MSLRFFSLIKGGLLRWPESEIFLVFFGTLARRGRDMSLKCTSPELLAHKFMVSQMTFENA